ncbi:hypothetical protein HRbin06_00399 [archaeon HR06]|nr:hypothetical protein HRbin06_00399 [archaeon HR06]
MVKAVGVDPGTYSFDIFGLEEDRPFLDLSISTEEVNKNPEVLYNILLKSEADVIVGPSGYGLPLKRIDEIDEKDLELLTLPSKGKSPIGLRKVIKFLMGKGLNIYISPSVKHLTTVPEYRKINKIDLGTADKVCSAILACYEHSKFYNVSYKEACFILVEMGYSFNAFIAVEGGVIVDGIGGSLSTLGFGSRGALDGELVCLMKDFSKRIVFEGGVRYLLKDPNLRPEDFKEGPIWEAFMEGIEKDVARIMVSVKEAREIILSGRLAKVERIYSELKSRLSRYSKVRRLLGLAKVAKESAQGAALLANGLAHGKFQDLIDTMRIKEAKGSILDYLDLE